MIIDDVTIIVKAGNGGKGAVAFNKNLMSLGPAGGSGGRGGSVFAIGVSDLSALKQFRFKKEIQAKHGAPGKGQFSDGPDSPDIILKIPVGTIIHNLDTHEDKEMLNIGETVLIAKGGIGGKGNFHFRSSRNTTPKQAQGGLPGEEHTVRFELKLIADVGLIGLPNAGKSSLLNALTNAKVKTANYAFTTLEPNLGAHYDLILADIPGLIEGASWGKGLGLKFLRHIERTKILFHLISSESNDVKRDYAIIRNELKAWNKNLLEKREFIIFTKIDLVSPKEKGEKIARLKTLNPNVVSVSLEDADSLEEVRKILRAIQKEKSW